MNRTQLRDRILLAIMAEKLETRTKIAERVGAHRPSVSRAMDRLLAEGFAAYAGYYMVTPKAEQIADGAIARTADRIDAAREVLRKDVPLLKRLLSLEESTKKEGLTNVR